MSDGECFKLLEDYIATFPLTSNEKFLTTTWYYSKLKRVFVK